jgi:hypothetical protein
VRRVGVLVCFVLAGGLVAAGATAATTSDPAHLPPAPTSTDHVASCDVPGAPMLATAPAGGTLVTFTIVPPGCD